MIAKIITIGEHQVVILKSNREGMGFNVTLFSNIPVKNGPAMDATAYVKADSESHMDKIFEQMGERECVDFLKAQDKIIQVKAARKRSGIIIPGQA